MKFNKFKMLKKLLTLKRAKGFGRFEIIQQLPAKARRRCDSLKRQEKAVRATMDMKRIEMQEELVILLLTDDQELIAGVSLYRGTSSEVGIDYRDIIQYGAVAQAYHIIVAHNHPDGHVQPSNADFDTASRLGHALRIAGFDLLDFVTVTRKRYYSMAEKGLIRA
jgi:DNA repair protein RadC